MKIELLEIQGKGPAKNGDSFHGELRVFFDLSLEERLKFKRLRNRTIRDVEFRYSERSPNYQVSVTLTETQAKRAMGTTNLAAIRKLLEEMLLELLTS